MRNKTRFNSEIPTCFSEGVLPLWKSLYAANLSHTLDLQSPTFAGLLSTVFQSSVVDLMSAGLKLALSDPRSGVAEVRSSSGSTGVVRSKESVASSSTLPASLFIGSGHSSLTSNGGPSTSINDTKIMTGQYRDYSHPDLDEAEYDSAANVNVKDSSNSSANRASMMSVATSSGADFHSVYDSEEDTDNEDRNSTTFGNLERYEAPFFASRIFNNSTSIISDSYQNGPRSGRADIGRPTRAPFPVESIIQTCRVQLPWGKLLPAWKSPKVANLLYGGFEVDVVGIRVFLLSHVSFAVYDMSPQFLTLVF